MLAGILWFIYLISSCLIAYKLGVDDGHFERKILYSREGKFKLHILDIQKKRFTNFSICVFCVPALLFAIVPGFSLRWLAISLISSVIGSLGTYSHGYSMGETQLKIGEFRRDKI